MKPGPPTTGPTIARIWRGRTKTEYADAYEEYNFSEGIRPLIEKAAGVQTFRRDLGDETEFVTISYWPDKAAMEDFAGSDPSSVHHLERDDEFLIELPKEIEILHLRFSSGQIGSEG